MKREETLEWFERIVATNPEVERKGATTPYTSVNGHMCSLLTKDGGVALRLHDGDREKFLKRYKTVLCEQHGGLTLSVPSAAPRSSLRRHGLHDAVLVQRK